MHVRKMYPIKVTWSAWHLPKHEFPSPVYPGLHIHLKLPWLFTQSALTLQLLIPSKHSFISGNIKKNSQDCFHSTNQIGQKIGLVTPMMKYRKLRPPPPQHTHTYLIQILQGRCSMRVHWCILRSISLGRQDCHKGKKLMFSVPLEEVEAASITEIS